MSTNISLYQITTLNTTGVWIYSLAGSLSSPPLDLVFLPAFALVVGVWVMGLGVGLVGVFVGEVFSALVDEDEDEDEEEEDEEIELPRAF
jgi:hypothetical protein